MPDVLPICLNALIIDTNGLLHLTAHVCTCLCDLLHYGSRLILIHAVSAQETCWHMSFWKALGSSTIWRSSGAIPAIPGISPRPRAAASSLWTPYDYSIAGEAWQELTSPPEAASLDMRTTAKIVLHAGCPCTRELVVAVQLGAQLCVGPS